MGRIFAVLAGLIGLFAFTQPFAGGEVKLEEGLISAVVVPAGGVTFDVQFAEKIKRQLRQTHTNKEIEAKQQAVRDALNGGKSDAVYLKNKDQLVDKILTVEPYLWGFVVIPFLLIFCGLWGFLRSFSREVGSLVFVLGFLQCSSWFIMLFIQKQVMKKIPHVELEVLAGSRWFLLCGAVAVLSGMLGWLRADKS